MIEPYYRDQHITLYCADAREILPAFRVDAIVTDPPYNETSLQWDRWPDGWLDLALHAAPSMWCFGSLRMFMERAAEFAGWKMSQEIIWQKHNGSNAFNDRFRRVHEIAAHFYRGKWSDIYKCPQFTNDATPRRIMRRQRTTQWGNIDGSQYESVAGGPRHMESIIYARGCHGYAVHPTQKPEAIIHPLIEYSTPPGGTVLDCFAGSGAVLKTALKSGRKAIGIEMDEKLCAVIVAGLSQAEIDF